MALHMELNLREKGMPEKEKAAVSPAAQNKQYVQNQDSPDLFNAQEATKYWNTQTNKPTIISACSNQLVGL